MNLDIYCVPMVINDVINKLDNLINLSDERSNIFSCKKKIGIKAKSPMRYAIVDFEGYFPMLIGILVSDVVFQFYIKKKTYQDELYEFFFEVLKIVKDLYIISFSTWEKRFIKILSHRLLTTHKPEELEFLGESLTIIDSQDNYWESLTSTMFSLNEPVSPDPILRVSRNVDPLFRLGYFDLIIGHNENCLKLTETLLQKRFFKVNLLEYECRYK